jgi:hypothetical protein
MSRSFLAPTAVAMAILGEERWFRVWIVTFANWHPEDWSEMPPVAEAVEPVDEGVFSAAQAAAYLEGFNSASLRLRDGRWAVAAPVRLRIDGDLRPGEQLVEGQTPRGACMSGA